jgi:sterol desaturase/sphingolipid hydroxylase (fatty acid hydroxylase superfamily)
MTGVRTLFWPYVDLVITVFLFTAVFYVIERVAPAEPNQPATKRLFNTAYYPFLLPFLLLFQLMFAVIYAPVTAAAGGGLLPRVIPAPRGFLAQLLFGIFFAIIWDFWQYAFHRLQHTWPVLWETHKFHHSETALNASTQGRVHFLHSMLSSALYLPMFIFFGWLAPHAVFIFILFRLWGFVNHANVRLHLGPLTAVVSNPQWHRIHHSLFPQHHDKNFAAFFPFIDMIFGTYYHPAKKEYPPTGIPAEEFSGDLREATVAPFAGWYRLALAKTSNPPRVNAPAAADRVS